MSNFAEYATSGAFAVSLSRNQVSALSMLAATGDLCGTSMAVSAALWRKGLVAPIDHVAGEDVVSGEVRLTPAGAAVLDLVGMAGLTNAPRDTMARELDEATAEIAMLREANRRLHRDLQSCVSRLRDLRHVLDIVEAGLPEKGKRRLVMVGLTECLHPRTIGEMVDEALMLEGLET